MPHQRKKSGHSSANTSMTDVRRAVTVTDLSKHKRPSMQRHHTPVSAQKLGRSQREREREVRDSFSDERESFPQYCMSCEKQFIPQSDRHLFCSEACRRADQNSSTRIPSPSGFSTYPASYSPSSSEFKDIIPRASPSRPSSMLLSHSPPTTPGFGPSSHSEYHHTSAISALRSLNIRPPSPPSPGGGIWPFARSAATSPSTSYTRPSAGFFSSTYDSGYATGGYTYDTPAMDRPLPSRHRNTHSRPKSIELVTPMISR